MNNNSNGKKAIASPRFSKNGKVVFLSGNAERLVAAKKYFL
jgi:hypothetical protein